MESRETVNYLKGIAILSVYVNHYVLMVLNPASKLTYSNGIISLFFVLSGYGIWYALDRAELDGARLREFYLKRAIRIFPMYWIATYIIDRLDGTFSIMRYLALAPFPESRIYWFVSFILQCYLLSPLMYLLIKRRGVLTSLAVCIGLMVIAFAGFKAFGIPVDARYLAFRDFPLSHLFLFFLGMMLPSITSSGLRSMANHRAALLFCALLYLMLVAFTERHLISYMIMTGNMPFKLFIRFCGFCLVFASALLCYVAINGSYSDRLPMKKLISLTGKHSYANYIFHVPFFYLLWVLAVKALFWFGTPHPEVSRHILFLLLTPAFLIFCIYAEKASDYLVALIMRQRSRQSASQPI